MLAQTSLASEAPVVQVQVEPERVFVGEPVTLRVSVYVPTWFPQPPEFPSFELPNTITRLPPNSSGPISARVNGSTWSGIQRRYQMIPLIAGTFVIDSRSISVTYADPASRAPITVQLAVPEIMLEAGVPAGAENLDPYIAGRSFQLERIVEGDLDDLNAGDALVVRYRASIEGLPAVFLPPLFKSPRALLQPNDVVGISAYADEPALSEDSGRSVREERVTLVFQAGGDFSLPGSSLSWWNLRTSTLERAQLDDLHLSVAGSGFTRRAQDVSASGRSRWWIPGWLGAVAGLFWLARPRWQSWRQQRRMSRKRYLDSEAAAFEQLQQLLRQGDAPEAYRQLLRWLWRLEPGLQSSQLAMASTDDEFAHQLQLLRAAARAAAPETPDYAGLRSALAQARQQFLARQSGSRDQALPALNPQ
jgi:hypothetical protein